MCTLKVNLHANLVVNEFHNIALGAKINTPRIIHVPICWFRIITLSYQWLSYLVFQEYQGVRQGFPLSQLLFLLFIEGLSMLIEDKWAFGAIKAIKVSSLVRITHLLFQIMSWFLVWVDWWIIYMLMFDQNRGCLNFKTFMKQFQHLMKL